MMVLHMLRKGKGTYSGFPPRFCFDGQEPTHRRKPLEEFEEQWDHPLWTADFTRGKWQSRPPLGIIGG